MKNGSEAWGVMGIVYKSNVQVYPINEELRSIVTLISLLIQQHEKIAHLEKEIDVREQKLQRMTDATRS